MSPALTNRFKWYPEAARQPADRPVAPLPRHVRASSSSSSFMWRWWRSPGFARNMNHIVVGTDDARLTRPVSRPRAGSGVVVAVNALANWVAWRQPTGRPARRRRRSSRRSCGSSSTALRRWPSSAGRTSRPSSGPTARCPPARSGRRWPPTTSRTTGSRCTAWWRTRSSCRWTSSGRWARRRRSRCTTASRAGRASPHGAGCRWPS